MIAEVIINSSASELNRTFDYNIPALVNAEVGMRVLVPFGYRKKAKLDILLILKKILNTIAKILLKL